MIISIVGPEKSGKTDWSLSAPKKLAHHEFDIGGLERAGWRYKKDIESGLIIPRSFQNTAEKDQAGVALGMLKSQLGHRIKTDQANRVTDPDLVGYTDVWYGFLEQIVDDFLDHEIKTVVVDSGTNMWPICHKALLQEKQEIERRKSNGQRTRERLTEIEYGQANQRIEPILFAARETNTNLIIIHHTTDERIQQMNSQGQMESVTTGQKIPAGWRHMRKYIDLEIWMELGQFSKWQIEGQPRPTGPGAGTDPLSAKVVASKATIEITGMHRDLKGMSFYDSNFNTIVQVVKMLRGESE